MARKPLSEKTVAGNVLRYRTGGLNIDATRIGTTDELGGGAERQTRSDQKGNDGWTRPWMSDPKAQEAHAERVRANVVKAESLGRWPANVIMDEEAGAMLDATTGVLKSGAPAGGLGNPHKFKATLGKPNGHSGGASRFFYCAKASKTERNAGVTKNDHPTVKPVSLLRYLVRLITPPDGRVLDPFAGSGSTGIATVLEGFSFIGIELDPNYATLARQRIKHWGSRVG